MLTLCGQTFEPISTDYAGGVTRTTDWRSTVNEMEEIPVLEVSNCSCSSRPSLCGRYTLSVDKPAGSTYAKNPFQAWGTTQAVPSSPPMPAPWRSPINMETAVVPYGHAPYDEQNLLQVRRPRLGGSDESLDCDRSCRRHRCHVSDYLRQRGVLRPGQHTQLLQYPHDD
jgi:hypothetical protein